jgi:asparagine synthase (glutamine-hydrolysing)
VHAYSIGFGEHGFSELDDARLVARHLGVALHEHVVRPDMATALRDIVYFADEPFADGSMIPTYYLARHARRSVTVCLSGDGADELFAGYQTYVADRLYHGARHLPRSLAPAASRVLDAFPARFEKVGPREKLRRFAGGLAHPFPRAHSSWRYIFDDAAKQQLVNGDLAAAVAAADPALAYCRYFEEVATCHYLDQAMYADINTWLVDDILVKVDRMTMAHGLEARTPLLDVRIVEFAARLPVSFKLRGLTTKYLLKASQAGRLPRRVRRKPKAGFNAPVSSWFAGELAPLVADALEANRKHGYFSQLALRRLADEHQDRRRDRGLELLNVVNFYLWLEATW